MMPHDLAHCYDPFYVGVVMGFVRMSVIVFSSFCSTFVFADIIPELTLNSVSENASEFSQNPGPDLFLRTLSADEQVRQVAFQEMNGVAPLRASVMYFYTLFKMNKTQHAADNSLTDQEVVYYAYLMLTKDPSGK